MKILVTGGAGYVGSHTTLQLIESGHEVTVLDSLQSGHRWAVSDRAQLIVGDVGDSKLVQRVLKENSIEFVIHFAAHVSVSESISQPMKYYRNNTFNTMNLIETCHKAKIRGFIFSSTAAVYGDQHKEPVTEESPLAPINPYGRSKQMAENLIKDLSQSAEDFRFVILRYFNVAGAMPDQSLGQATPNATNLIKVASECAAKKRDSLSLFGDNYETKDGTCIRDYIHVVDLATAHIAALNYLNQDGKSDLFNCGYGHGFSVKEVVDCLKGISQVDFTVISAPRREGDVASMVSNSQKIKSILGWQPQFDDLKLICQHAFLWEKKLSESNQ